MPLVQLPPEKRFKHDRTCCVYKGSQVGHGIRADGSHLMEQKDWYVCTKDVVSLGSVVCRMSDQGYDYASAPLCLAAESPFIHEALRLGVVQVVDLGAIREHVNSITKAMERKGAAVKNGMPGHGEACALLALLDTFTAAQGAS